MAALVAEIRRRATTVERPFLVALDGFSGAGKSTAAGHLARALDAAVVHVDDFYRDLPEATRARLSPGEGVDQYFDWPRLRDEALTPLAAGRAARFRRYHWEAGGGLDGEVRVPARPVVVVEGVYSARPELSVHIALAVLVDAPAAVRRQRIVARDGADHAWPARWDAAEALYFQQIRPPSSFDVVIPGLD